MAIDLMSIFVQKAFEWGVGKALDAAWKCACDQRTEGRLANVSFNVLECRNCRHVSRQFTNACRNTVRKDGPIAQIGFRADEFSRIRDRGPLLGEILGWQITHVEAQVDLLCQGFPRQQLIEVNEYTNLNTGERIHRNLSKFTPSVDDEVITRALILKRSAIGSDKFTNLFETDALVACDVRVENRFQDLLYSDRVLCSFA